MVVTPGAEAVLDVPDRPETLLVVDQFEELFTLCDDAARRAAFVDALLARRGRVAIGVRADVYGRLGAHADLAAAVAANQVLLGAMTDDELARAIAEPARLAGLRLEPGLVELILRDVAAEPGALPLLSHALRATWERRDGRTLTVEGYRASGGVTSAIARTADDVIDGLPADGASPRAQRLPADDRARRGHRATPAGGSRATSSCRRARPRPTASTRCSSGSPRRAWSRSATAPRRSRTRR